MDSILFYQTFEFTTMANRSCLLPTIILLSVLLLADIGLISGMAQVISRKAKDGGNAPEDGLLLYGLVILPLIAVSMFIVIVMLTISLIGPRQPGHLTTDNLEGAPTYLISKTTHVGNDAFTLGMAELRTF